MLSCILFKAPLLVGLLNLRLLAYTHPAQEYFYCNRNLCAGCRQAAYRDYKLTFKKNVLFFATLVALYFFPHLRFSIARRRQSGHNPLDSLCLVCGIWQELHLSPHLLFLAPIQQPYITPHSMHLISRIVIFCRSHALVTKRVCYICRFSVVTARAEVTKVLPPRYFAAYNVSTFYTDLHFLCHLVLR